MYDTNWWFTQPNANTKISKVKTVFFDFINPGTSNGKNGASEKSGKGRRVQFDSKDDIPEAKFDMPNGKGDSNGGKGDKAANGGKAADGGKAANGGKPTVLKALVELNIDKVLPNNAKCLMDCEAAEILQETDEAMVALSEDASIKLPPSFSQGLNYAKSGGRYTSPQEVRKVLEPLKEHGVSDGEICVIANISPESVDEVFALMSSLKGKKSKLADPLKDALRN